MSQSSSVYIAEHNMSKTSLARLVRPDSGNDSIEKTRDRKIRGSLYFRLSEVCIYIYSVSWILVSISRISQKLD